MEEMLEGCAGGYLIGNEVGDELGREKKERKKDEWKDGWAGRRKFRECRTERRKGRRMSE